MAICCKCGKQYPLTIKVSKLIKHTFCSDECWNSFNYKGKCKNS